MRLFALLMLLALTAVGAFAFFNWPAFTSVGVYSLGFTTLQFPLGAALLGVLALMTVAFLGFALSMQAVSLRDSRRHAQESRANRDLADRAEASRFTELRHFLELELAKQADLHAASISDLAARMADMDRSVRRAVEENGNALAASLGELEDRLEHTLPPLPAEYERDYGIARARPVR